MSCKICDVSDEEKERLIKEFSNKVFPIFAEYSKKLPETVLASYLIYFAKSIMLSWKNDYYLVLGLITDMVNDGLHEQVEIFASREGEKNAPYTL